MSTPAAQHSAVTTIHSIPGFGIVHAAGTGVPADGETGFAKGCLFQKILGADEDAFLFLNVGTITSANFDAINVTLV